MEYAIYFIKSYYIILYIYYFLEYIYENFFPKNDNLKILFYQYFINRVAARIALRMEQLSNLPTNMPEDLRIQAQIELRMLRVLNFQRQLRSEVIITILIILFHYYKYFFQLDYY